MKKNVFPFIAIVLPLLVCCQGNNEQSDTQDELIGVYQPIDYAEGMMAITEKYFVYAARWKDESSAVDSIDYYENEYNLLRAEGQTWTRQDSIITCTYLFDKDPSMIGQSWRFTYSFEGDTFLANILDDNNEVILSVSALKLE